MPTSFKIAWRYFRGKKDVKAINIISRISIFAIMLSSAAMIVLFSVFNGLENTIQQMYASFYSDLKILPQKGKFFAIDSVKREQLSAVEGIAKIAYSIEDMALLSGQSGQHIATLKGVNNDWFDVITLRKFMYDGQAYWEDSLPFTPIIPGLQVAYKMALEVGSAFNDISIYYPQSNNSGSINLNNAFSNIRVQPTGIFNIDQEFDNKYVLTTLETAQDLFSKREMLSSVEIKMKNNASEKIIRKKIVSILDGNDILIEDRYEQNRLMYTIMNSEKLAVYAILLLVLFIASFNMIAALSMLVMEKKKDIGILKSMGASEALIRNVFLYEGIVMAGIGGVLGVFLGLLLCLGQQYFGWISLPEGFVINAYPVAMELRDFIIVILTVLIVGVAAAWVPAKKAALQLVVKKEN